MCGPLAPAKTGNPINPIPMYTACDIAPHFGPKHMPERSTKNTCSVKGTMGKGILIQAPTAVRHTNNPAKITDFVSKSNTNVITLAS